MGVADRIVSDASPPELVGRALRRAAELLAQANEAEARGDAGEAASRVREAARALFAASAREPLLGVCRRLLMTEGVDPEVDRELGSLVAALEAGTASRALLARAECHAARARPHGAAADAEDDARRLAAEHLVAEAQRLRRAQRAPEAVRCLAAAARLDAPDTLHREWAFALAAEGDVDGALGHVEAWWRSRPEDPAAMLWRVQLLWRSGRRAEARDARELLEARLGDDATLQAFAERQLGLEQALAWAAPGPPFWWAEARAPREEASSREPDLPRPLLVLDRDDHFFRLGLSRILRGAGFETLDVGPEGALTAAVDRAGRLPAAFVVHFEEPASRGVAAVRALRERRELARVPVLAITTLGRRGIDLAELRELGVVGVLDKRMIPEDVVDRVRRVLGGPPEGRRFVRVPAFFPVDLEAGGVTSSEYARNLSVGGMGLLTSRPIAANTDVRLRFRIEEEERDVEVTGRVIYRRAAPGAAEYELGIFFYPMEAGVRAALERAVEVRRSAHAAA